MASAQSPPFLQGFNRLSPNVWYISSKDSSPPSPDLIIICTWMAAVPRHIAKYIVMYQTLYPASAILVIRNELSDILIRPRFSQMKRLEPVLEVIERYEAQYDNQKPRILLHTFSNGGSIQATLLAQVYRTRHQSPLPVIGMIMDSSPGAEAYWPTFKAFTTPPPKFLPLRWLFMASIHLVLIAWLPIAKLFPRSGPLYQMRQALNNPILFPSTASRTYLYSKTDKLIRWQDVEAHAKDARESNSEVRLELFTGSQHVGHIMTDPERYSNVVRSVSSS